MRSYTTVIVTAALLLITSVYAKPKVQIRTPVQHIDIRVEFNIEDHTLEGVARLTLPRKGPKAAGFLLNKEFEVTSAAFGDVPIELIRQESFATTDVSTQYGVFGEWDPNSATLWKGVMSKKALKKKPSILEVHFKGSLYSPPDDRQFSRESIALEVNGTIGTEGIYLSPSSYWYPRIPDGLSTHNVTVVLPQGWNFVTDGKPGKALNKGDRVELSYTAASVSDGISLAAGPYVINSIDHNGVEIATYFLPEQADLSDGYLEACKRYMDMYTEMLGDYPFPRFVVVDNFLPSGYGMPGWTLLGSEVLRLPFIKDISLGHEICHNWMGNSLFVDYREGNWCEGLTTYLADYKYKEDKDSLSAIEYRMEALKYYTSYVNAETEYPVSQFVQRSTQADRAIGYNKVMMIFHMLRLMLDQVAPDMFYQVVGEVCSEYQWQAIGWKTWQREFERRLGQKLDWFFQQWVENSGVPTLSIASVKHFDNDRSWDLQFEVITEAETRRPYNYMLQLRGVTDIGVVDYQAFIRAPQQVVKIAGPSNLQAVVVDPAFNMMRTIYPGESSITLANFFGDSDAIFVVPTKGTNAKACKDVAEGLKKEGQIVKTEKEMTPADEERSMWIIGGPNNNWYWDKHPPKASHIKHLEGRKGRWKEEKDTPEGMVFLGDEMRGQPLSATTIWPHHSAEGKYIVHTLVLSDVEPVAAMRKLSHYGKYSYLLFENDQNIKKGVWRVTGKSPLIWMVDN